MARVLVTGSTAGLGRDTAEALLAAGHTVCIHARNPERAGDLDDIAARADHVFIGDLASLDETLELAETAKRSGRFDAVIHNAGIYGGNDRRSNSSGIPAVIAVNVLAPYILTAQLHDTQRFVYLSSDMHHRGTPSVDDLDWAKRTWNGTQAYCDSKLLVTVLATAVARIRPDVFSNAVDPGWVPTRMGGPRASDDLELGHVTQVWLATSDDPSATASAGYWYHQQRQAPAAGVHDRQLQDDLLAEQNRITGIVLHDQ